jgi:hypothetical protein
MKILEHKGRILRTAGLIAALAVASLPTTTAAAFTCIDQCAMDEAVCEANCGPAGSGGRFICIATCRENYRYCSANCP